MKRITIKVTALLVVAILLMSQAFAITITFKATPGYDIFWTDDVAWVGFFLAKQEEYGLTIANVSHNAHTYTHMVEISYDELASKVTLANNNSIVTTLHQNTNAGYWVGYVYDVDQSFWDATSQSGVLSNGQGYVYVAEIDTTGEDTVSLLESINRNTANVSSYINSVAASLQSLVDSHRMIRDWFDEWDAYFTNINTKIDSVSTNVSSIMADVENMRLDIFDMAEFLTGEAMASMLTDVSTINTNIAAINTFNNSLKTHITTIRNNTNTMVTLLEELKDKTVTVDTTVMEATLNTHTTHLQSISSNTAAMLTQLNVLAELSAKLDVLDDLSLKLDTVSENTANITIEGGTFDTTGMEEKLTSIHSILSYLNDSVSYISRDTLDIFNVVAANGVVLDDLALKLDAICENTANISIEGGVFDDAAIIDSIDAAAESVVSKLDGMSESTIENITNITINEGDPAYEVFYVTDQDGDKKNLGDLSADMLIAGGKLLNFFFKVAFDGAIESVDSTIDGMTEFYLDDAVVLEGSLWE